MKKPQVSVIIPTYNRANCLSDAIDSALTQTFDDLEIIVVDDGSTDETHRILAGYGDRIYVVRKKNGGVSSARNAGLSAARGEWIAFLDSDDIWEPRKLEIQIADLRLYRTAVAHMVDTSFHGAEEEGVSDSLFVLRGLKEDFESRPIRLRPLSDVLKTPFFTSGWMVRRHTVESAGLFNHELRVFEDLDLLTRIALEGPFVVNSYVGIIVRRKIEAGPALSDLYQKNRIQSLQNLVHTYQNLKRDFRLSEPERKLVCRLLGGAWTEIAIAYAHENKKCLAANALFNSVRSHPNLRSFLRACVTPTGMTAVIRRFRNKQQGQKHFRRSELDGRLSNKLDG